MKPRKAGASKMIMLIDQLAEKTQPSSQPITASITQTKEAEPEESKALVKWEYHGKLNAVHLFQLKRDGIFDNAILFIIPAAHILSTPLYHVIYESMASASYNKKYDSLDANQIEHIFGINVSNIIKETDISFNGLLRHIHSNINDLQNMDQLNSEEQIGKIKSVLNKFFYGHA